MEARINQVGILTSNFDKMVSFYRDVLGFTILLQLDKHAEFINDGVRFAISENTVMAEITGHPSYSQKRSGQPFELAFAVKSSQEVDETYAKLVEKGAIPIKDAKDMPWNQRTAFFADPDGNIHEIFADLAKQDE